MPPSQTRCSFGGGVTTFQFVRKLAATDAFDVPVLPGLRPITFAWGFTPVVSYHMPGYRGSASVDFYTGNVNCVTGPTLESERELHGLVMVTAWTVLAPLGLMAARYFKYKSWYVAAATASCCGRSGFAAAAAMMCWDASAAVTVTVIV